MSPQKQGSSLENNRCQKISCQLVGENYQRFDEHEYQLNIMVAFVLTSSYFHYQSMISLFGTMPLMSVYKAVCQIFYDLTWPDSIVYCTYLSYQNCIVMLFVSVYPPLLTLSVKTCHI